jgi:GT2 family glycosyltransferase
LVVFINPDAIVEPEALRTMLEFMLAHPAAGVVGPATLCGEGDASGLQHTGRRPTPWTLLRDAVPFLKPHSISWDIVPGSAPARAEWVCGAVLMIRSDLMRRLGGFDPRFFLYWEEMDLCKRVEDAGFECWVLGAALARHTVGASSAAHEARVGGSIARFYFQSRYYYMAKHHGRWRATLAEIGELFLLAIGSLADLVRGRGLRRLRPRLQAPLLSMPERVPGGR